ncbi:DUF6602 domain-containing protein [Mycolicibacterium peregrinum]|uniref:DUF6602 domain-containing protein n=1 Tax=Mycolicibacterium peregrinum TaxID=43304 RepID=UPI00345EB455
MPPQYEIGARKYIVADAPSGGAKSRETDLVVFHPSYPRVLRGNTTVLASGVVAAFGVKLTLDAAGLSEAIESAQAVRRLLPGPRPAPSGTSYSRRSCSASSRTHTPLTAPTLSPSPTSRIG